MKHYIRLTIFVILALMMAFMFSCTTKDKPTTPNFEQFTPYIWDYNHVLWFDLDYSAKLGAATADVWLSAKGEAPEATLKINNQPVEFTFMENYTEGNIYSSASVDINTTQPVTYEITYNGHTYTGNVDLPDEVSGNFPTFVETNNFAPSWTITGDIDPSFQVIEAYAEADMEGRQFTSQIAGTERNFSLLSTFWEDVMPVNEFYFNINAILYKMKNSNKVLTVGVSHDDYGWFRNKQNLSSQRKQNVGKIMDLIHADMHK